MPGGRYRESSGGGIRLMPAGDPRKVAAKNCCDIEYRYEISLKDKKLYVRCLSVSWYERGEGDKWVELAAPKEKELFSGTFDAFSAWVDEEEAKERRELAEEKGFSVVPSGDKFVWNRPNPNGTTGHYTSPDKYDSEVAAWDAAYEQARNMR